MADSTTSIFRSARRFFSGTALSRITGMFRDMAMAFAFGTQETITAFMVAFRFAHLLRRLFGEGPLQTAFIPQFEELRTKHPQKAYRFFLDLYTSLALLLLGLIVCIGIALATTIHFEWLSNDYQKIAYLTLLMMPSLLFICLFGLNAALLQCEKKYFISSVAPVAFNLIWILGTSFLWWLRPPQPMHGLALVVILACAGQWLMTVPHTWTCIKQQIHSFSYHQVLLHSADLKKLISPLFLGMIGVAAAQINNALDALFARYADPEGPALLWYSIRIQQLPLALLGIAISSALLPPLSRAIKSNDRASYTLFLDMAVRRSISLMIPVTCGMLVLGDSCINFIYGRGDFNDLSTIGTTWCLWAYAVGLLPMALVLIFAPAFYAQSNYRIPALASTLSVVLNMVLNTLMIVVWGWGAVGIALATSLSAWFNLAILAIALRQQIGQILSRRAWINILKVLIISFLSALAVCYSRHFFWNDNTLWLMVSNNQSIHFPRDLLNQTIPLMMQSFIFVGAWFLGAWTTKTEEMAFLRL